MTDDRPDGEELKARYGEDWGIKAASGNRWWRKATTPEEMEAARLRLQQLKELPIPDGSPELVEAIRRKDAERASR